MENNSIKNKTISQEEAEEVNIWEILQKFGLWGIKVLRCFFIFILRKSVWLACFAFTGVIIGGILYISSKPYYGTYMLARVNVIDNFFYISLINENLSPNNIDASQDLVRKLGITESTAKQIHSIRAHYCVDLNKDGFPDVIDKNNKYATSLDSTKAAKILPNMFHIKIQAYSSEIFPHVRQSIIDFINKNSYVQRQNARRIEEISEQISYLHQQQSRFDSLQQYEYFQKQSAKKTIGSGQLLVLNEQIQPLYHGDLIALNDQILGKNTLLQLYSEPITIIQDFTETSSRENNMMFYIKPLGIAGLLIGLIFIIIRDYRKPLWDLYNKKVSFAPKITE